MGWVATAFFVTSWEPPRCRINLDLVRVKSWLNFMHKPRPTWQWSLAVGGWLVDCNGDGAMVGQCSFFECTTGWHQIIYATMAAITVLAGAEAAAAGGAAPTELLLQFLYSWDSWQASTQSAICHEHWTTPTRLAQSLFFCALAAAALFPRGTTPG